MSGLLTITSYGRGAGSARARVFDWTRHLGLQHDHLEYVGSSTAAASLLLSRSVSTVTAELALRSSGIAGRNVLLSRQASPLSNGAIESRILSRASHGVYDFDDALDAATEGTFGRIWSKRRVWKASVTAADTVIAGNDDLAERASRYADRVVVIPTCIEPEDYELKATFETGLTPTAVWIGTPSTERYLLSISRELKLMNTLFGLRLRVISSGNRSLGELDEMVDRIQWTMEGFPDELAKADFGIMPLDDTEWSRGKCAYKLLQYGAAGLPMIGSPVGANSRVLELGDGLAPTTSEAWADAMESLLLETSSRREQRGRSGREAVRRYYSYSVWAELWKSTVLST